MFTRSFTHYRGGGAHFIESPSNVLIITLLFFNPIINDIKLLFIIALNEVIFCEKKNIYNEICSYQLFSIGK